MVYSNYRVPATATVTEVKFGATPIKISQMIKKQAMVTLRRMAEHRFSNVYIYQSLTILL